MIKKTKNPHELTYLVVDPHDGRIPESIFQSDDFNQCLDVLEGYYDRTGRGRVDAVIVTYDAEIICRRVVCDGESIDEARRWAQARSVGKSRIHSEDEGIDAELGRKRKKHTNASLRRRLRAEFWRLMLCDILCKEIVRRELRNDDSDD